MISREVPVNIFGKLLIVVSLLTLLSLHVEATHLRAGQITVERVACPGLTVKITVTVYTDTGCGGTCILFGGHEDILRFGDGFSVLVPMTPNTPVQGATNVGTASFSITHTFPGPGRYTISYREPMRNNEVVNITSPGNNTFYLETEIDLSVGCSNSPVLLVPPIDEACSGVTFLHNPGASDRDGDSLSYELVVPLRDKNTPTLNYRDPNVPEFYAGLNYDL
ncbi:MAG TPA: hypothetical protein VFU05_18225, partial [Cyclobacteriaceae bacterium]|nr:hypothetical protein [Cyclobacteriaceae bacterium]